MGETIDPAEARALTREYADDECAGTLGEILDVKPDDGGWIVEFQTHTFSEVLNHRIRISKEGNVYSYDRVERFN